ncbi:plantaricin C family lantibiotic [Curtobacterium sp. MCLR17_036]|uniref:plantaricin C family lantibiotic n=1 Tax=Curtobacterium sp. MCLR17_036 TaxID=2175620 RepID=UPI0015E8DE7D|nr:plantaricin C family lantibiotic [Curtobacterium sp. MCLR17_036]WIE65090.1 plantaricin C family lantibiotic [Curtobacterium sp. MCLR17_036]
MRNVSVLEEIDEQGMSDLQAGQGIGTTVTTLSCYGVSWALGNDGNFCTATVECQSNCK